MKISYIQDKTKMEGEKILFCVDAKKCKTVKWYSF